MNGFHDNPLNDSGEGGRPTNSILSGVLLNLSSCGQICNSSNLHIRENLKNEVKKQTKISYPNKHRISKNR